MGDDSAHYRDVVEVRSLIERLSPTDRTRLMIWAKTFHAGSGFLPEDLLQEGLLQVWAGDRRCAKHMQIMPFMKSTIRSIAHGGRVSVAVTRTEGFPEEASADSTGSNETVGDPTLTAVHVDDALRSIYQACDGHEQLEEVVLMRAEGFEPKEIMTATKLSPTAYDSALKRIRRLLLKVYPEGWRP